MIESLYIAESGLNSQQKLIEIISNNIANNTTPSFKRDEANFVDLVLTEQTPGTPSTAIEPNQQTPSGVKVSGVHTDFAMGSLKQTNNPLDIAIKGNGFIEVELNNGELAYTKAGRLRIDENGFLTNSEGLRLSSNVQISPDAQNVTIKENGNVFVTLPNSSQLVEVGNIELVTFANTSGLAKLGNNLYSATMESGQAVYQGQEELAGGEILQGYTEMSNVTLNEEMVNLMLAQRGYQLNARIIQVTDQVMETINNLRR